MRLLVIGHSGFLGRKYLEYLNGKSVSTEVVGISKNLINLDVFPNLKIKQYTSLYTKLEYTPDFILFLSHSQHSRTPLKSEIRLASEFTTFMNNNNFSTPIIMLKSEGKGSEHIKSRTVFNEFIKNNVSADIFEIRVSIIAEKGSISYEIPYRILRNVKNIPRFPWFKNKVSIVKTPELFGIFDSIIDGKENSKLITPKHETLTYEEYIKKIADSENIKPKFINVPFNEFLFVPFMVSRKTGFGYFIVRNLMTTLKNDSVL